MDILGYQDYRPFLRDELERRIAGNAKYSLRAFARDLQITPQGLSSLLRGKKGLSAEAAARIAERLELDPSESSYFMDLVALAHARNAQARTLAEFRLDERHSKQSTPYRSLELEAFKAISDWHHYAILELTCTKHCKNDPKWIAERLGISSHEVNQAVGRLKAMELLEEDSRGRLHKTELNISASYEVPSSAVRKFTRQMLSKAIESLDSPNPRDRDITTITMAIDPKRLPHAMKMIDRFRRSLCKYLEQGDRTEVYTFIPTLFKITKPETKERS